MVKKKKKYNMIIMGTVIVIILGLGMIAIASRFLSPLSADQFSVSYEGQLSMEQESGPVKIMEFGDFKCPHCKTFNDQVLPQLKKDFIDTGKVQFFFTNFAFLGEDSHIAAQAGVAVYNQNKESFWQYYDEVYSNQKDPSNTWATPEFLVDLINRTIPEIDANQVSEDLKNRTYEETVYADKRDAEKIEVNKVPQVFVNQIPQQFFSIVIDIALKVQREALDACEIKMTSYVPFIEYSRGLTDKLFHFTC